MANANQMSSEGWRIRPAMVLTLACLLAGFAGGYLLHVWQLRAAGTAQPAASAQEQQPVSATSQAPNPAQLKAMADSSAAPLLQKLRGDPNNPDLLASVGNLYYDAHQYPAAVDYYGRELKVKPADTSVRTDMGTAYWYMGNAAAALAAYDQVLTAEPTNANALYNRGVVEWKGRNDAAVAIADWKKLLAANPAYAGRAQVEQMMAEAQKIASPQQN
ncbi:MAG: tetratricopeptide repeat protein [Acidobacteriaceae bacterium]